MDYRKVNFWQLLLLVVLFAFLLQAIHEGGHWAVYQAFGRGPVWGFTSLVQLWSETPLHPDEWVQITAPNGEQGWVYLASPASKAEEFAMLAAGPLATLLAAIAGLVIMRSGKSPVARQMGLLLTLVDSFVYGQYYLRAPFRSSGGDEFFMAAYLGIPKYVIEIPLGLALVVCFILGLRALGSWQNGVRWMGAVLPGSFLTGLFLMQANQIVQTQINQGNPLFQPVLGFSLPVAIVNSLVVIGLAAWWYRTGRSYDRWQNAV